MIAWSLSEFPHHHSLAWLVDLPFPFLLSVWHFWKCKWSLSQLATWSLLAIETTNDGLDDEQRSVFVVCKLISVSVELAVSEVACHRCIRKISQMMRSMS
jgi:hypothetical protein